MSLREWLVLIGILVIAVVIIDGYRRLRLARKRASELSFGLEEVKGDTDDFSSELPNGGARKPKGHLRDYSNQERHLSKRVEPELSGMGFGEDNNTLGQEPENSGEVEMERSKRSESFQQPAVEEQNSSSGQVKEEDAVPILTNIEDSGTDDSAVVRRVKAEKSFVSRKSRSTGDKVEQGTRARLKSSDQLSRRKGQKPEVKAEHAEKLSDRGPAAEVIVINVMVKGQESFDGQQLMNSVMAAGMRFGDMSIFHRYTNSNGTGKILFSMANGVKPGNFNLEELEQTSTPAVSFFMGLPGPEDPIRAFTKMVETARKLALDVGGELKDEQHSVMTLQTIEHCRQRIIDYERKQLTHKVPG
ncbi:cell division protein ZipA [Endozoicomonas sp. Mp262]